MVWLSLVLRLLSIFQWRSLGTRLGLTHNSTMINAGPVEVSTTDMLHEVLNLVHEHISLKNRPIDVSAGSLPGLYLASIPGSP